ncbi:hypothetical protein [Streptomyces beigongshangae]|uniref:hypothetical protein n=1 Tax=Streptomyces beigongshangae TaxID=2841597 RepID=UPI001C855298|nr:hypothetical protein [Streptomyces sp. REN17]
MADHESGTGDAAADALRAAITDEPLPDGALEDEEFAADHRAALADVAVLREQLKMIGAALAEPEAPPGDPAPRRSAGRPDGTPGKGSRRPRARRAFAVGTMIATALAGVVVGMSWLVARGGGDGVSSSDASSSKQDADGGATDSEKAGGARNGPIRIACARIVVEGTVVRVEGAPGTRQDLVTVDVDRYYKPEEGKGEITFPMAMDAHPPLRRGDQALVVISGGAATPDILTTGEREIAYDRAWILKALPEADGLRCTGR